MQCERKNVIIFGAGAAGIRIKRDLERAGDYEVCFFCDNDVKKQNLEFDGVKIISFLQFWEQVNTHKFCGMLVITANKTEEIVDQIRAGKTGGLEIYGLSAAYQKKATAEKDDVSKMIYPIDYSKPQLSYIEYHVSNHCNLKCKGCGHYSNLADTEFGNLQQYIKDLRRLKELFWGIKKIRLMGGEPLLNRELPEFINQTREVFPGAEISIVTNGLLIPNVSKEVFYAMRMSSAFFEISQYFPTSQVKEKITLTCLENQVVFSFGSLIEKFFFVINKQGKADRNESFAKCDSKTCHFLHEGKLAVCPFPVLYPKYKDRLSYKLECHDGDVIDLYDDIDGFEINKKFSKAIDMCKYCDFDNLQWFKWEGNCREPMD